MDLYGRDGGIERKAEEYSAMSREELLRELDREAAALRARGMLDTGRLEEFMKAAAPYMTAEQLARMRELINALR